MTTNRSLGIYALSLCLAACAAEDNNNADLIGPEGGSTSTRAGDAAVVIPEGAIDDGSIAVTIDVADPSGFTGGAELLSAVYDFGPNGSEFDSAVTISIELTDDELTNGATLARYDEANELWEEIPGSYMMDGRVFGQTTHFSFYSVVTPSTPPSACQLQQQNAPPNSVLPLAVPNVINVSNSTKTDVQASGYSGPNPLELGSTWVADTRWVTVTGDAGIPGEGAYIDWSTQGGGTMTVGANGGFSITLDLHTQGPFFGITDACLAPFATPAGGWVYALNVHCGNDCAADNSPAPGPGGTMCGPTELCMRTINQCGQPLTQAGCEAWYMTPGNCVDMATYTTCNCACINEPICQDYFDCGQTCFNNHC